jgi:hypothetical protein
MRTAVAVIASLMPGAAPAQGDAWSVELLAQYASWVRAAGFACAAATRITEAGPESAGVAFKVTCAVAGSPDFSKEVTYRLTVRPNAPPLVRPWHESSARSARNAGGTPA